MVRPVRRLCRAKMRPAVAYVMRISPRSMADPFLESEGPAKVRQLCGSCPLHNSYRPRRVGLFTGGRPFFHYGAQRVRPLHGRYLRAVSQAHIQGCTTSQYPALISATMTVRITGSSHPRVGANEATRAFFSLMLMPIDFTRASKVSLTMWTDDGD